MIDVKLISGVNERQKESQQTEQVMRPNRQVDSLKNEHSVAVVSVAPRLARSQSSQLQEYS